MFILIIYYITRNITFINTYIIKNNNSVFKYMFTYEIYAFTDNNYTYK